MQEKARRIVLNWYIEHCPDKTLCLDDVYIVWFCKTLQNWKALVSTNIPDGRYFEVTHNGDKNETYLDCYVKEQNQVVHY